jgi:hypothetical protein
MLVRSQSIPARLVTGFYGRSERFDARSGMTEILPEDTHTWAEVYVQGAWIPIEPCGSYARPREHLTWSQWGQEAYWRARDWIRTYPWTAGAIALVLSSLILARRRIANATLSSLSLFLVFLPGKMQLQGLIKLMSFRRWLAGQRMPKGWTLTRWLDEELREIPRVTSGAKNSFLAHAHRLLYAPQGSRRPDDANKTWTSTVLAVVSHGMTDMVRIRSTFQKRAMHRRLQAKRITNTNQTR